MKPKDNFLKHTLPKLLKLFSIKYLLPFLTVGTLTLIRYYLHENFGYHIPLLFYTIVVFLHAVIGGVDSGIITTLVSTLAAKFLFPHTHLNAENITDVYAAFYILQGAIISFLTHRIVKTTRRMKRINQELFQNEKLLKVTIDSLLSGIVIIQPNGKIVDANGTFIEMNYTSLEEIEGEQISSLRLWNYSDLSVDKLNDALDRSLKGEKVNYEDVVMVNKNEYINAAITVVAVREKIAKNSYIVITVRDITERVSYQKELEKIKLSYSRLIDSNIIGMCIRDKHGSILDANNAFLEMIGYEREDIETKKLTWDKLVPREFKEHHERVDENIATKGYSTPIEKEYIHHDGHRVPVILSGVQIDPENGTALCLVLNMTERKELEQKKDEFISMASHELKTPVTSLKGYSQLLHKNIEQNFKYVNILDNQITKLTNLINELLDVSKIEAGKLNLSKQSFNTNELIQEIIEEVQPLSTQHTITFNPSTEVIVEADRSRISQVLINLLTNAIKYSPKADKIEINVKADQEKATISVQDFGDGIPEGKKKDIFQKFYRAEKIEKNNLSEGLGLGLYISSEIVARHGSNIVVESTPGEGSVFSFTLPLA